jgi:hypothetical protein
VSLADGCSDQWDVQNFEFALNIEHDLIDSDSSDTTAVFAEVGFIMDSANRAAAAVHSPESTWQTLKLGSRGRGRSGQHAALLSVQEPYLSSFATLPPYPRSAYGACYSCICDLS